MKRIIFGGGFDPIHLGHLNMAQIASDYLHAEVIFVPAPIAIWKEESVSPKDKIAMVELAIQDNKNFSIDLFEMNSGRLNNYSIDTVKYFKEKYPNDELYYLIGGDQVNSFHKWKSPEELSSLAKIIFVARPGVEIQSDNIEKYHIERIEGPLIDVSSTEIRELKSIMVPRSVLKYIEDNKLYFINKISTYIKEYRLLHSISVAELAYDIALKHNINSPEKAYIAGLLHDIGKEYKDSRKVIEEHYKEYVDMPLFSYHQFVGAYLASKDFGVQDESILNAIKYHATGSSNMDELAMIIYASDKIDPRRDYDSSELISAMMDNDIETGFKIVLRANKEFLNEENKMTDNPLTTACFDKYL